MCKGSDREANTVTNNMEALIQTRIKGYTIKLVDNFKYPNVSSIEIAYNGELVAAAKCGARFCF